MKSDSIELLTVPEVAALLRMPVTSIYRLTDMRRIPVVRIGRVLRFERAALAAWIAKQRVPVLDDD